MLVGFRLLVLPLVGLLSSGCASFLSPPEPMYDAAAAREGYREMLGQQAGAPAIGGGLDHLMEGDRYTRAGDLQRAVVAYFQAARLDPEAVEPPLRLAHLQLRTRPDAAEASFQKLVGRHPEEPRAWYGVGLSRLAQSKLEGARDALLRAVELQPDVASYRTALGVVYDRLGASALAREQLEHALALEPEGVTGLNNLGVSLMLAGDLPAAEERLRRAVALAPGDLSLLNNLALCVGLQERYDEARRIFQRGGSEQSASNNLGFVYYLTGRPEQALEMYERALVAEGNDTITVLRNIQRVRKAIEVGATRSE